AQGSALVPSMIAMLLGQPLEAADLSELTAISSGAAPLAEEVRREFEARVPTVMIYEGYGCTESATLISANPAGARRVGSVGLPVAGCEVSIQDDSGATLAAGQDGEICVRSPGVMSGYWHAPESASLVSSNPLNARRLGSVGLPVPGCEVSIQDDAGKPLPAGENGEICVRSPGVLSGYWHAPEATATALAGGWLHTGDIGHLDADGYLYVVDRKKDLIIRGGFNVYPRDVEDVLLTHPAVVQAGVVGRPDPRLGEEVVAFAALRPGATVSPEELIEHAKAHLAATKYPREVRILPGLPLTPVGKSDRKQLRALLRDDT
ncbi:MAG: AMP-binding protein, partial [Streptosporangiaceae bacterium]